MNHKQLTKTLAASRAAHNPQPIHQFSAPVIAYAKGITELKGESHVVVSIPEGSQAHKMGYRYVSIPHLELPDYEESGATLVPF